MKAFGPIVMANAFAWSAQNGLMFPFNVSLTYNLLVVVSVIIIGYTYICIPRSVEKM